YTVRDCTVSFSGNSQPGFWCDMDSGEDPYNRGNHVFDGITAHQNDLEGIICNCPNSVIRNSRFTHNGVNVPASGALGACGIYNDRAIDNMLITGNYCSHHTEFGINGVFKNTVISGNICEWNDLAGIF